MKHLIAAYLTLAFGLASAQTGSKVPTQPAPPVVPKQAPSEPFVERAFDGPQYGKLFGPREVIRLDLDKLMASPSITLNVQGNVVTFKGRLLDTGMKGYQLWRADEGHFSIVRSPDGYSGGFSIGARVFTLLGGPTGDGLLVENLNAKFVYPRGTHNTSEESEVKK